MLLTLEFRKGFPADWIQLPAEATHWASTMMAKLVDPNASSMQRIWRAHGLQPRGIKHFKLCRSTIFRKLCDIIGLYIGPPYAVVLSSMRRAKSRRLTGLSPACR
jgi:hypothetical protein